MTSAAIDAHQRAGRRFTAAGVESFVLDQGASENGALPVLCIHGVPVSSYLYRRVIPELAQHGLRGVAFDLPGLGLADRPADFDYSWSGLGRWSAAAVDALELERVHLVVHDIGGPVGFELAAAMPERVASLTILNTMINAAEFTKPWPMRPFEVKGLGELWLASMQKPMFRMLMGLVGIEDMKAVPRAETNAHVKLLKRGDGGKAFLKIMRSFETTAQKQALYRRVVGRDAPYPRQVVWGEHDPALTLAQHGQIARHAAGVKIVHKLPGKHFLQEDCAPALAAQISRFVQSESAP